MNKNGKHRSRRVKLPLRAYLLYLLLASFLMTGVTFSKYITASSGGDSARVASMQELRIDESASNGAGSAAGKWVVIPGVDLKKDAEVQFGGSEASTYVFVKLGVSEEWKTDDNYRTYTISDDNGTELMSFTVADNWGYLTTDDKDSNSRVYICKTANNNILAPNTVLNDVDIIKGGTIDVTDKVTETNIEDTESTITLRAFAVQSSGFESAADAWASVYAKTK